MTKKTTVVPYANAYTKQGDANNGESSKYHSQ